MLSFLVSKRVVSTLRNFIQALAVISLILTSAVLIQTQHASAALTCNSHPIIPPDGTDSAIGAITATEADPGCTGLNAWVPPSTYDAMPTRFAARDAIQVFLPDADRPASSAYKARIQAESGSGFTTVNATCSTGTVFSNNTTVVEVELADGASCALTAQATLTGELVSYQATLARSGDKYTLASGVASGGNFDRPEISLKSTETSFIADGGTDDWGSSVPAGVAKTVTYTITNFGYGNLNLTGTAPTTGSTSNTSSVIFGNYVGTVIAQGGGTTTFEVTLTPTAAGAFTHNFTVLSDDVSEATYNILISGTAVLTPELDVRNNADDTDIADGELAAAATGTKGTDFGNVNTGANASSTFRAENNGTSTLTFTAAAMDISDTTNFSITTDLTDSGTIAAGGNENFVIRFNPTTTGTKTATVTIRSDDADEDPFTFQITGVGTVIPTLTQAFGTTEIASGGTSVISFIIGNQTNTSVAASSLAFTANLPTGMTVGEFGAGISSCGGTVTATPGASSISLSGGSAGAASGCSIDVDVTSTATGTVPATTLSSSLGSSDSGTATLTVVPAPTFTKSFSPSTIASGGTSTLSLTINNSSSSSLAASSLAFIDTFPTGMTVASTPNFSNTCGGSHMGSSSGNTVLELSSGSIAAGASCTFSIDVTATQSGTNTTGILTSSLGISGTASDSITVASPPTLTQAFGTTEIASGGASVISFVIGNQTNTSLAASSLAFTANLPTGMTVAAGSPGNSCGGTVTATTGASSISLSGGSAGAASGCLIDVNVTSTATGTVPATTLNSSLGPSDSGAATLTVASALIFTQAISPASIPINSTSTITYTVDNSANGIGASNLTFSNTLPTGMSVASTPNASTTCGIANFTTATSGSTSIGFNSGSMSAGATCTIQIDVTATQSGTNTTGDFTSNLGNSSTSSASLTVTEPEISISSNESGSAVTIADEGTEAHGSEPAGTAKTVTYTITNSGTGALTLTNAAPTLTNATNVGTPTVGNYTNTTIAAAGTATFSITYTPDIAGAFSFDLDIISDDSNEANYDIAVSGVAISPEIKIVSTTNFIADGGTDALGIKNVDHNLVARYTITNIGTDTLTLTDVAPTLSNLNNVIATIGGYSMTSLPVGISIEFHVTYSPIIGGAFSYDLDVISNDIDEANFDIAASGTAYGDPEIAISSSESGAVADAGTDAQGSEPAGTGKTVTYTITNSGTDTLILIATAPTVSAGSNAGTPTVGNYSTVNVAAGGGIATFTVTYTPTLAGAFSFEIDVISNDTDEATYDIAVSGTASGSPEIDITSTDVTGSAVTDNVAHTITAAKAAGAAASITYVIDNTDLSDLTLTTPTNPGSVTASSNIAINSITLAANTVNPTGGATDSTTLVVNYTPTSAGPFSFSIDMVNDDANENPFTFTATGTATGAPEIAISSSESGAVVDAGTDAQGSEPAGTAKIVTYTITNSGTDTLNLTNVAATLIGATNAGTPTIGNYSSTALAASGGTATFTLTYTPDIAGAFSFDLDIISDDADEGTYDITVSGTATGTPEIAISSSETGAVADGGSDAQGSEPAGTAKIVTYTITNSGTDTLNLTNAAPIASGGVNVGMPTIGNFSSTALAASGGTATFTITYTPAIAGAFSFDLDIISDDADEANYDVAVSGTATGEPEIEVSSSISGNVTTGSSEPAGSIPTGATQTITYTVTNTGTDTLILSGISLYVPGFNNVTASSNPPTVLSVPPLGGTSTINAFYTPVAAGAFSVGYTIGSNDSDESSFVIGANGTAVTAPELDIRNGLDTTDIIDGETHSDVTTLKGTDFGTVSTGSTATSTFRVENNGNTELTFGADALSIDDTANFTITSDLPNSDKLAASDATTFAIQFNPTTSGNKFAVVTVRSDDGDEDPYTFTITGLGVDTTAPRISSIERNTPTTETTDEDSLIWRVTFNEVVTGVDTSDFSISDTTAMVTDVTAVSTTVYDVTVSGGDLDELNATVTLTALTGGGNIEDASGNDFANATPTGTNDNTFIVENTIPATTVTVTSSESGDVPDGGMDNQGDEQIGAPKTVKFSFTNEGSTTITITGEAPTIIGSTNAGTPAVSGYSTPGTTASLSIGERTTIITQTVLDTISSAIVSPAYAISASSITLLPGQTTTFDVTYTPTSAGAFSIDLDIISTVGTYDLAVSGTAVDTTAPTVAINGAPETHDTSTSFNVTFEFSEDVTGFVAGDITVANGSISNFIAVDGNTYTADITPSSSLNVTIDVASSVAIDAASIGNTAAVQTLIKGTIVAETQTIIADFMTNRANNILSNQPDMIGFINGSNNGGGGPLGNLQLDSDLDNQTTMSFYTSRSKILAARNGKDGAKSDRPALDDKLPLFASADRFGTIKDEAVGSDQLQANNTDEEQLAAQSYNGNDRTGTWDVWTQINGAKSSQTNVKSEFWSANFGTHYFINNDTLIGMLTQFDWAEEVNSAAGSTVSGNGYLVGPYIAGKVKDQNLFYEARALWGKSSNDITPIGTYTDSFETERWLASLKVQGSYDLNDELMIKPGVSISYFEETQESYTDTNSNLIPEQTISLGQFKFGPTLTRSFDAGSGFTMRTTVGVSGIMNFGVNNANTSTSNAFANEELRARIDAGIELENEYGIRFTAAGYYDGIGAADFQSYGGALGLVIPLN